NTHINIGCGKDQSIEELALMVKKIVGYKGEINWDKNKPDGTFQKLMDVSKLNNLGWSYKTYLENGIKMVYKYYIS
ncbi:GDP-L-fucose synthase, partial [Aureibaculum marinum]